MKKTIIFAMAALMLLTAQCKKNADTNAPQPSGETMEVTVRVDNGTDKTTIDATGVVAWKSGDKLYVVGETQGLLGFVSATADGDPAIFEGSITALTSGQVLRFYYVGDQTFSLTGDDYTFSLGTQDGSLAGIAANNQLMWGKTASAVAVGATSLGTISMTSCMAIAHLNITGNSSAVSAATVTGGFASTTFNAKTYDGATLTGTAGDIAMTFTSPTVSTSCYIALLPGTQTLKFSNSGTEATLTAKTVAANMFYNSGSPIAVEMEVPVETDEWINFNDPLMEVEGLPIWSKKNIGATNGSTAQSWYGDYYDVYRLQYYLEEGHGDWRVPTGNESGEWQQLKDNTLFVWTTSYRGITNLAGYVVYKVKATAHKGQCVATTGESGYTGYFGYTYALTDPHMFLPATDHSDKASLLDAGSIGYYWSSSLGPDDLNEFWGMYFDSGVVNPQSIIYMEDSCPVREVQ